MQDVQVIDLDLGLDLGRIADAVKTDADPATVEVRSVEVGLDLDTIVGAAIPAATAEVARRVEVPDLDLKLDISGAMPVVEVEEEAPETETQLRVREVDVTIDLDAIHGAALEAGDEALREAARTVVGDSDDSIVLVDLPAVEEAELRQPSPQSPESVVETVRLRETERVRKWSMDFGPVWAPAGEQTVITVRPQCLFRGENVIATDTGSTPGRGTRILSVAVAQRVQRTGTDNGTLTQFFAVTALANGVTFDTSQRWATIAVVVSFIESCTFDMSVFGTAVVD